MHSWFASTDDWDNQYEGVEKGWPAFFRILKIYLAHFRGQPSDVIPLLAMSSESKSAAWDRLLGSLGLARLAEGQRVETVPGAPRLAGIVERVVDKEHEELFLRLEEPTSGVAHLFPIGDGRPGLPVGSSLSLRRAGASRRRARDARVAGMDQRTLSARGCGDRERGDQGLIKRGLPGFEEASSRTEP